jgi:hypothetical protein
MPVLAEGTEKSGWSSGHWNLDSSLPRCVFFVNFCFVKKMFFVVVWPLEFGLLPPQVCVCVCVCVCVYSHTLTYMYMYAHIHAHTHTYTHIHTHICIYMYKRTPLHTHTHTHTCIYI